MYVPKKSREQIQRHMAARRARMRAYLDEVKSKPCTDCHRRFDPVCMDFDHVRGEKLLNISQASTKNISIGKIKAEIEKCELVCACCHRLRTKMRPILLNLLMAAID
jgi:hypothetical protein